MASPEHLTQDSLSRYDKATYTKAAVRLSMTLTVLAVVAFNVGLASLLFLSLPTLWGVRNALKGTAEFLLQTADDLAVSLAPAPDALRESRTALKNTQVAIATWQQRWAIFKTFWRLWQRR